MLRIFKGVEYSHVIAASEILKQKEIIISPRQQYWVRMPDGNEWPYKALVRESVYQATKIKLGDEFQSNETNRAEFERLFGFEIIDSEKLLSVEYLGDRLNSNLNNIWRCADSAKWYILKITNLLTFDWLEPGVNYLGVSRSTIGNGKASIYPWVNDLKFGDLIFVMTKDHYFGIAIAKSEYNYSGPFLEIGDGARNPAIEVKYLHKLEEPISHGLETSRIPKAFSLIDQYRFGLKETLTFLGNRLPGVFEILSELFQEGTYPSKFKDSEFKLNAVSNPPDTIKSHITDSPSFLGMDTDYMKEHRRNKERGDFGERYFEFLIEKNPDLIDLGSPVVNVEKQKDGIGYDYKVKTENGDLCYVEIKSTASSSSTPFYMSHNEKVFLEQNFKNYRLLRFHNLNIKKKKALYFMLTGNELKSGSFDFKPTNYEVSLKPK